jgi:hypothetical protein
VNPVTTSGEWREERFYVLRSLDTLQQEQRRQSEQAAMLRETAMAKAQQDIKAAHDKIRSLENGASVLRTKNWIMTALLSTLVVLLIELIKWRMHP